MISDGIFAAPHLPKPANPTTFRAVEGFQVVNDQIIKRTRPVSIHPSHRGSCRIPSPFGNGDEASERFETFPAKKVRGTGNLCLLVTRSDVLSVDEINDVAAS
jgi:hypothetical protein